MKKKPYVSEKKQDTVSDPVPDYKVTSGTKLYRKKKDEKQRKLFARTLIPKDFPDNCVTMNTFFSDLEDYIHKNDKI